MAHNCPECGEICYCNGDVDDMVWDDDSDEAMTCTHYLECDLDDNDLPEDDNLEAWGDEREDV